MITTVVVYKVNDNMHVDAEATAHSIEIQTALIGLYRKIRWYSSQYKHYTIHSTDICNGKYYTVPQKALLSAGMAAADMLPFGGEHRFVVALRDCELDMIKLMDDEIEFRARAAELDDRNR